MKEETPEELRAKVLALEFVLRCVLMDNQDTIKHLRLDPVLSETPNSAQELLARELGQDGLTAYRRTLERLIQSPPR